MSAMGLQGVCCIQIQLAADKAFHYDIDTNINIRLLSQSCSPQSGHCTMLGCTDACLCTTRRYAKRCFFDLQMAACVDVHFLCSFLPILVSLSVPKSALLFLSQVLECVLRTLSMCLPFAYSTHFFPG